MKFDELDAQMRVYETAHDLCVLPEMYIVTRLDGRSFTRLTREIHSFAAPYDGRFRDYMVNTAQHLMNCGFNITIPSPILYRPCQISKRNSYSRIVTKKN
jgi:tRNA(His) 5'-end guanylyltransferase